MPQDNQQHQVTGKQRAIRMPLDYYKQSDRIEKTKNWLSLFVAAGAAVLWLACWLSPWPWGNEIHSRGDLAAVHGIWNKECNVCHKDFQPISQDAKWVSALGLSAQASDASCKHCHAGPPHHQAEDPNLTPTCAHCHRDHQGRDFDLKRTADGNCTGCHASLTIIGTSTLPSNEPFADHITGWVGDTHPNFRSIKKDEGKLKFNHALHMAAGMVSEKYGDPQLKLDKLDEADQARYRQYFGSGKVQLDCAACHRLDSYDFETGPITGVPSAVLPQRAAGAYFLPITYENQCKACHPLSFERKNPDDARSGVISVPHRWQPSQIQEFLEGHYTAQFLSGTLPGPKRAVPLPGKDTLLTLKEEWRHHLQNLVSKAERDLFTSKRSCGECHYTDPEDPKGDWSKVKIAPTNVPEFWFKHARFDHAAHRAMKCLDCHAEAMTSTNRESVLIPNRDNCLQCHNTPSLLSTQGRARTDCVECHRYHNGDQHGQGTGAQSRGVKEESRMTVETFLRGGAP